MRYDEPVVVVTGGVAAPYDAVRLQDTWQQVLSRGGSFQRGFRRTRAIADFAVLAVDIAGFTPAPSSTRHRDAFVEGRDWATIPTHLDYGCLVRVDLSRRAFVPTASLNLPRLPTLDALLAYTLRLFRLSLRVAPGLMLALLIRAGRVWVDFRPARSPGRLIRCGGQVTRGPDISRKTHFPVIRGVPLAHS